MRSPVPLILSWSRRHRFAVTVGALCLAVASVLGLQRITFDTDILSLLPRDGRAIPAFRTFAGSFGSLDHLYVVFTAPAGYSIADYDREIQKWIDGLRAAPEISRVDTGTADKTRDLSWVADRQLLLLPDAALDQALSRFQPDGMRRAIAARRELLAFPSPAIAELVRNDPLGLFDLMRQELGGAQAGVNIGLAEGGYMTEDGRKRMIIALPRQPPYDTQFSHALYARLDALRDDISRATVHEPSDDPRPSLEIEYAGGHRIALETEALVRRESIANTVGALALMLPFLLIVFRSVWLVSVGALPSTASLLLVLGVLGFVGATLSAAATASAAMLFGLGVDGVVLLYVAYALALAEGTDPETAVDRLSGPASSMLLGMWTTAATFYGLVWVDFPSLEQLGLLIGHSMVLCGLFTLVIVAAYLPRQRPIRPVRAPRMPRLAAAILHRRRVILALSLLATIVLGAATTRLRVDATLDRLRSVTPGATVQEQLSTAFRLPRDVHVVLTGGPDLDQLLTANERLVRGLREGLPGMAVQAPSSLLPGAATQTERASKIRASGLSPAAVDKALIHAAEAEGFRQDSFNPFRDRMRTLLDSEHRLTYEGYQQNGFGDLIGRFVARNGDRWLLASYVFPDNDAELETVAAIVSDTDPSATFTGMTQVNRELADRFVPQFLKGLATGAAVVLCLVIAAFRDWRLAILSLVPTMIGLVWAAGLLALMGIELDLFALFAVVTFVGIGVDYGIHLVHRYREHGNPARAIEELGPVILVAAAITMMGYGTLMTSGYPPLRSIGAVAAVSIATLAVASLFTLPAMLMVHSGRKRA